MKYSTSQLVRLFPEHQGATSEVTFIERVFTDSRNSCKRGIFVPIIGDRFDGHDYLNDAINNGAVASFWEKDRKIPDFVPTDFPLFFVEDTIRALQGLSKNYLKRVNPKVIGITGSNGKTTTKDIVESVMAVAYRTFKTQGNYNNHIGLPLTILSMPEDTELLILEMGMNNLGEISVLSELAEPDIAIITNIGESHIENLGSRKGIAKAKLEITDGLKEDGTFIFDGDEPLLINNKLNQKKRISCGFSVDCNYSILSFAQIKDHIEFQLESYGSFAFPLLGAHNVKNATYAVAAGRQLGLSLKEIQTGLLNIKLTGMRLEKQSGINGSLILNDAYNASPTSMKAAISTVQLLEGFEKKVLVLGDMFELGKDEEAMHRSIVNAINEQSSILITVGKRAKWIAEEVKHKDINLKVYSFEEKEDAESLLKDLADESTVILFKASRGMAFETLVNKLSKEIHSE